VIAQPSRKGWFIELAGSDGKHGQRSCCGPRILRMASRERLFPGAKTILQCDYWQEEDVQRTEPRLLEADMRIAIQAMISDVEGQDTRTQDIGVLEYDAEAAPASGLGLFIGEAHQLLRQLQTVVLREQAARFVERVSRCRQCGSRLGVKDAKTIVYRTVYGKARLDSPRLYSTCGRCGARATPARSFSPLADALPERTHPQWLWLQSRYAAVMSYRQAAACRCPA
jgi:uncharacterized protein with PIN domain